MLLQFSVTNHRSIKETSIISLKASTDKSLADCLISPDEKKQLVPVLALYGANLWEQKCGWMPHCLLSGRAALKRAVSCMKCCAQTSASRTSHYRLQGRTRHLCPAHAGFQGGHFQGILASFGAGIGRHTAFLLPHRNVAGRSGIRSRAGRRRDRIQYAPAFDPTSDRDGTGYCHQYEPRPAYLHHP